MKENACELDLSVVSFLPGLVVMKTTVLESMRTLSYFRLDTLAVVTVQAENCLSFGLASYK